MLARKQVMKWFNSLSTSTRINVMRAYRGSEKRLPFNRFCVREYKYSIRALTTGNMTRGKIWV